MWAKAVRGRGRQAGSAGLGTGWAGARRQLGDSFPRAVEGPCSPHTAVGVVGGGARTRKPGVGTCREPDGCPAHLSDCLPSLSPSTYPVPIARVREAAAPVLTVCKKRFPGHSHLLQSPGPSQSRGPHSYSCLRAFARAASSAQTIVSQFFTRRPLSQPPAQRSSPCCPPRQESAVLNIYSHLTLIHGSEQHLYHDLMFFFF